MSGIAIGNRVGGNAGGGVLIPAGPTRIYLSTATAPATPSGVVGSWGQTTGSTTKLMTIARPSAGANVVTPSETSATPISMLAYRGVTPALLGQTITADTLTIMMRCVETDVAADAFLRIHAYVMKPDGTVRGTLMSNVTSAVELPTALTVVDSMAVSSVDALAGDRLVFEIGANLTNVSSSSLGLFFYFDGNGTDRVTSASLATASNPWIEFAQGIGFGAS